MAEQKLQTAVAPEIIEKFLNGRDPMERITFINYTYRDDFVTIYYRDKDDNRCSIKEPFFPFVWAKRSACLKLCGGDRKAVKNLLKQYGIGIKLLNSNYLDGRVCEPIANDGYIFLFYAENPMSYSKFLQFFKAAKNPIYSDKKDNNAINNNSKEYLIVTPQEQHMIRTGKRYFKGYEDYDEVYRMVFDLETSGLNPQIHCIEQIGIRSNRGFEKILKVSGSTPEERKKSELKAIDNFFRIIYTYKPDVITAHNGENFDWAFVIERCNQLGTSIEDVSSKYFNNVTISKSKRESVLKLGGEVEYFFQTNVPSINVTDSLHAVRRAQAIDSNMQKADLKYVTKYSKLNKANRVYISGDKINKLWNDNTFQYALNDTNGDWYKITEDKPLKDGYEPFSGQYIVARYLLDDLFECEKVELRYNQSNFLVCKLLPVPFMKCCTMGTAGQWKMMMLAWSYENSLGLPPFGQKRKFTGGLSRLLKVGFIGQQVKLDFNSLYPSITLTWNIKSPLDLMGTMLAFLEHMLTQREKYKGLMKKAGKEKSKYEELLKTTTDEKLIIEFSNELKKWASEESSNDKKQLPLKIMANSYFGSTSNPSIYPWGDIDFCGEKTTTIARQCLRLMIKHFTDIGYIPVVGDTDGFNFALPQSLRYNDDNPYIGKGLGRNVKEGQKYTGVEADVAEFEDLFFSKAYNGGINKMGLGIDEYISNSLNLSRKNYCDLFPDGKIKLVGNTIKSKKMATYIEKFLNKGLDLLLHNQGQKFIEEYYDYIEKIYNYQIPLKDIASKGKIKKSVDDYLADLKILTKAGRPKSRQAWYELIIANNEKVDVGDTVYYINTGKSKSHSDVKKITHQYIIENGEKVEITKTIDKEYKIYKKESTDKEILSKADWTKKRYPTMFIEEEIILNSKLLPRDIVDSDDDYFCDEGMEYNVPKYIEQFNKRISPLLVCFNKNIRNEILINNPNDRKYFTEEQAILTSGEPNKPGDQDTYEALMTLEDKEIRFWKSINEEPPFIKEMNMNWEEILKDYNERMEREKQLGIDKERELYENIIDNLTEEDVDDLIEEGEIPKELLKIIELDPTTNNFVSKRFEGVVLGNIYDLIDKDFTNVTDDE